MSRFSMAGLFVVGVFGCHVGGETWLEDESYGEVSLESTGAFNCDMGRPCTDDAWSQACCKQEDSGGGGDTLPAVWDTRTGDEDALDTRSMRPGPAPGTPTNSTGGDQVTCRDGSRAPSHVGCPTSTTNTGTGNDCPGYRLMDGLPCPNHNVDSGPSDWNPLYRDH